MDSLTENASRNPNGLNIFVIDSPLSENIQDIKQYSGPAKFLVFDRDGSLDEDDPDTIETPTIGAVIDTIKSMI